MAPARSLIGTPEDWILEERRTVGPFVTRERYRLPDGSLRTWSSRRHRKTGRPEEHRAGLAHPWWRPALLGWWVGALFIVGSALFALGSFPPYATATSGSVVGVTYFVGSIFFTTAGYLQYVQTISSPDDVRSGSRRLRLFAWQPHRIGWWAASVQSVGTLLFNRSTFHAMDTALSVPQQERLIWAPDMFGSIAFMIASTLAWLEVCHGWWRWDPRDTPWRIVALDLAGSLAFQLSAIAAFVRPATGELLSIPVADLGTFVGAVCFLIGAALLIPELAD
jgi:YrhK-like protein